MSQPSLSLFDFLKSVGGTLKQLQPKHFLMQLAPAAMNLNLQVPEGCWWGIKFLDSRYLFSPSDSPSIEIHKFTMGYRLSLTGPCHVEPGLSFWQLQELEFLGWESPAECSCVCFWTELLDRDAVDNRFLDALNALYTVYGISENCRLIGSSKQVMDELISLEGTRRYRVDGSIGFSREQIRARTREDLR